MGNMTFHPNGTFYLNNTPINGLVDAVNELREKK